jgi:hypothetical protein
MRSMLACFSRSSVSDVRAINTHEKADIKRYRTLMLVLLFC